MKRTVGRAIAGAFAMAIIGAAAPAAHAQSGAWDPVSNLPSTSASGAAAAIKATAYSAFTLNSGAIGASLRAAPKIGLKARSAAASSDTILTLPKPDGSFERFRVENSPIMEAGLAAQHAEIQTYEGVSVDDPSDTLRADQTPLGFHASVRSDDGDWYIDPYYQDDTSAYVSYFGRDLVNQHGSFIEPAGADETSFDPFDIGAKSAALAGTPVVLRTYRLALITDPSYATYWGAANVTAAKVTLINRVDQFYEDETAIRLVLINDTDKTNLNTDAQATGANGPCGAAACYTTQQLSTCGSGTLSRNRIVLGQIIGASNYDIGHIGLGKSGGGIASLAVVGGNNKAQGCTGVPTPQGDYYAIDYVAHEMGHEFAGNHTFNGTQSNCSGGNRNAATSVEPGSGTSVMAYAGICAQDNLQPHSDPYWSQRSFDEITTYTSSARNPISEVQTASLVGFDGSDSFTLSYGRATTPPIVHGVNYTQPDVQGLLDGQEVEKAQLASYDADGDSFTLNWNGVDTVPIVHGQNNTVAGIQNAFLGGNEQQQVNLSGFDPTKQSLQLQLGGGTSATIGLNGAAFTNAAIAAAINAISGFTGTASVSGASAASPTGFTVTFAGASANTDVASLQVVNCTLGCTGQVRETAKGGVALSNWPAGQTIAVSSLTDAGFTVLFGGPAPYTDVPNLAITNPVGVTGAVLESVKGGTGILPAGTTAGVAGFGGGTFDDTGFQVTFGGTLANVDIESLGLALTGATGWIGETARGGAIQNTGYTVTPTGNTAPVVTVPAGYTIPTRTPFSLTGSATDADNDPLTYMWEQNDRGAAAGTALVSNTKKDGPLFRQFGTYANVSPTDTLITPSPGENHVDTNPTRVFPDMSQILIDNTNAATGTCPAAPTPATAAVPVPTIDCYSEFLPTSDWTGFLGDRTMTFRLTARDGRVGGGGVGHAETKVAIAPMSGPFRVTSQSIPQSIYATSPQTITWSVNGTDQPPVNAANVKITLSLDGGQTFPVTIADSTPNDGSLQFVMPNVTAAKARFKIEAVGNVFFDVNHADFAIVAAPTTGIGGTVPATLSLTLGSAPAFGAFTPGITKDYDATTTATVTSSAGDAALSVADATGNQPGHLVNGTFTLPSALQAKANGGALSTVSATPVTLLTYSGPVASDPVTLGLRQHIDANDALRTGSSSKTLTYTLSTTTP
jgi:hypothetical protein